MPIPLTSLLWRARGARLDPPNHFVDPSVRAREKVRFFKTIQTWEGLSNEAPACWLADLEHARVVAANKVVATATNGAIGGIQMLFRHSAEEQLRATNRFRPRMPVRKRGISAILEGADSGNYYHWLFDSLPRLRLLEIAGYGLDEVDSFLLGEPKRDFRIQSMMMAGLEERRVVFTSKNHVLHCERLLVPSMPSRMGYATKWACEYLRSLFLDPQRTARGRRIFISRARAKGRRISNENQLKSLFRQYEIDIVHAESLSFAEQVALFASCDLVIGIHGAGLSNIVWCNPGTRVLELRSPVHSNECFSTIAGLCELDYASEVLALDPETKSAGRFSDLIVDPKTIEILLKARPV